jgi:hypothetical protein
MPTHLVAVSLAALLLLPAAAAAAPVETFRCELPSLVGGEAQASVFELSAGVLRRQGGAAYDVLADDGDTVFAVAADFAPDVAVVVLVRSTGLLKILAITDDRVQDPVYFGSCRG